MSSFPKQFKLPLAQSNPISDQNLCLGLCLPYYGPYTLPVGTLKEGELGQTRQQNMLSQEAHLLSLRRVCCPPHARLPPWMRYFARQILLGPVGLLCPGCAPFLAFHSETTSTTSLPLPPTTLRHGSSSQLQGGQGRAGALTSAQCPVLPSKLAPPSAPGRCRGAPGRQSLPRAASWTSLTYSVKGSFYALYIIFEGTSASNDRHIIDSLYLILQGSY